MVTVPVGRLLARRRVEGRKSPSRTHAKTALKKAEPESENCNFMGSVGRWAKTVLITWNNLKIGKPLL